MKRKLKSKKMEKAKIGIIAICIEAASKGDLKTLKSYAAQGMNLSLADYDGRTPLHLAVAEGHYDAVEFLLKDCKVNTNAKDRWGKTALHGANHYKRKRKRKRVQRLLRKSRDIKADNARIHKKTGHNCKYLPDKLDIDDDGHVGEKKTAPALGKTTKRKDDFHPKSFVDQETGKNQVESKTIHDNDTYSSDDKLLNNCEECDQTFNLKCKRECSTKDHCDAADIIERLPGILKNISPDRISKKVTKKELGKLAYAFGLNWELFFGGLGLTMVEIYQIKPHQSCPVIEHISNCFKLWYKKENKNATWKILLREMVAYNAVTIDWDKVTNFFIDVSPEHSTAEFTGEQHSIKSQEEIAKTAFCIYAAYLGDLPTLQSYAAQGTNMSPIADYDGRTPLHLAATEGHYDVVEFLLKDCKVNPNAKDRFGDMAIDCARDNNHSHVEHFLKTYSGRYTSIAE